MPSDFLRDVLRTDDAVRRAPRRWLLFPLSLAVHALGAAAYFVIPLAAEVTPPTPRPLHADRRVLIHVLPPEPRVTPPAVRFNGPTVKGPVAPVTQVPQPSANPVPLALPGLPVGVRGDAPVGNLIEKPGVPPGVGSGSDATAKSGAIAREAGDTKPLKIGGSIRAPQRLAATPPVYPPIAQSARVSGVVILEALIDVNGRVADVRVLRSIPLLDAAAVDAVRTWRYTPTLLNGVPVSVLLTVTVNFTLQR